MDDVIELNRGCLFPDAGYASWVLFPFLTWNKKEDRWIVNGHNITTLCNLTCEINKYTTFDIFFTFSL